MSAISFNAYLESLHYNIWNVEYEACKAKLIEENNYKSSEQAFECAENNIKIKILGTILFRTGSIFKSY